MLSIKDHLIQNLQKVSDETLIGYALKIHFAKDYFNRDDDQMLKDLFSQYDDNPRIMVRAIKNDETIDLFKIVRKQFIRQDKINQRLLLKQQNNKMNTHILIPIEELAKTHSEQLRHMGYPEVDLSEEGIKENILIPFDVDGYYTDNWKAEFAKNLLKLKK